MKNEKKTVVKNHDVKIDKEYIKWIGELAQRYRSSQIKAAIKVNDEMLRFYWSVGEDIEKRQYENRYGSHFYENVSKDLRKALDLTRGMSESTIRYTHYFYCLYSQLIGNRQQDAEVLNLIFQLPWTLISEYEAARQQLPDDLKNSLPTLEEIENGLMDE